MLDYCSLTKFTYIYVKIMINKQRIAHDNVTVGGLIVRLEFQSFRFTNRMCVLCLQCYIIRGNSGWQSLPYCHLPCVMQSIESVYLIL